MPRLIDFPGCCTAKILTGFGQSDTAEYYFRPSPTITFEQMYAECEGMIEVQKRGGRVALIFATTNSDQKMGEQVLEKLGFQRTLEVSKTQHSDKTVTGWWIDVGNAEYRAKKAPKASGANWGDIAKQVADDVDAFQVRAIDPHVFNGGQFDRVFHDEIVHIPEVIVPVFDNVNTKSIWDSLVVPQAARDAIINVLNADGNPDFVGLQSYLRVGDWRQQINRIHDPSYFAVGDRVRVMSTASEDEGGWGNDWVEPMDAYVGEVGVVKSSDALGVEIQFEDHQGEVPRYQFPSFVLRKYL